MDEYINRKQAVDIAESYGLKKGSAAGRHSRIEDRIAEAISIMPESNVNIVRHGRWIRKVINGHEELPSYPCCSACGCVSAAYRRDLEWLKCRWKYCPNCGARMDLEENNG